MTDAGAGGRCAADTVEQVVREQLAVALGGFRGSMETAIPTVAFTISYIVSQELGPSLVIGISAAAVLVLIRAAQRSPMRYVLNSLFGILIAAVFAARSGHAKDAFLPGILYNGAYAIAMIVSVLTRWPVVGFLVGAATGDPTGWRADPAMVKLCSRLTWLLLLPCVIRVVVEYPMYSADAIGALGTAKVILGWPLQVAALAAMGALLARSRTPLQQ
ncbi:MAG TPA: DUF3159 domain-containing protein [Sporichthyaceae bacterium]|jgi:hypothetical protein